MSTISPQGVRDCDLRGATNNHVTSDMCSEQDNPPRETTNKKLPDTPTEVAEWQDRYLNLLSAVFPMVDDIESREWFLEVPNTTAMTWQERYVDLLSAVCPMSAYEHHSLCQILIPFIQALLSCGMSGERC